MFQRFSCKILPTADLVPLDAMLLLSFGGRYGHPRFPAVHTPAQRIFSVLRRIRYSS